MNTATLIDNSIPAADLAQIVSADILYKFVDTVNAGLLAAGLHLPTIVAVLVAGLAVRVATVFTQGGVR